MTNKLTLTFLLVGCFVNLLFAQKEGNVWHFGTGHTVNFNSGVPVLNGVSNMITFEGCASWSDANGNLLFYTNGGGRIPAQSGQDGGKIWNRNHDVMYDMQGVEGGGFSSVQSAVVVPKIGSPNVYYLFTMDEVEFNIGGNPPSQPNGRGLSYFEIDMTLNGGLGGVSNYVQSIYLPVFESLCAVRHANGSDYWIVVQNITGYGVTLFPVTAAGVGSPIEYDFGFAVFGGIEASPDGTKMALSTIDKTVVVDFDAATGTFGNADSTIIRQGQFEFSPNSQRLLMIADDMVWTYDLNAINIGLSEAEVGWFPNLPFGEFIFATRPQLGPDTRIYFVNKYYNADKTYLTAINCPNSPNASLSINIVEFPMSDDFYFGLPNFADHIFAGEDPPLPITASNDTTFCIGGSVIISVNTDPAWSYSWSNGDNTAQVDADEPGLYAVSVTDGCRFGYDSVLVSEVNIGIASAQAADVLCLGATLDLDGTVPTGATVTWSATPSTAIENPNVLETTASPTVNTAFVLTAERDGCTVADTVTVTIQPQLTAVASPVIDTIDLFESVNLLATGGQNYTWTPADGLSCTNCANPVATPSVTTTYIVTASTNGACPDTASVEIVVLLPNCQIKIPNAFAPEDMQNNIFGPVNGYRELSLNIYSRWGQNIYTGTTGWNGQHNGLAAPPDVYIYRMSLTDECGQQQEFSGQLTLLR
jgi:gliding motility-associated-like protein